jgi:hypothetical protein
MRANAIPVLVLVALATAGVRAASAQTPISDRPYRGLFAGGVGDVGHLLTASGSIGGGYDDNILADASGVGRTGRLRPEASTRGTLANLQASLAYSLEGRRTTLSSSFGGSSRYYPSVSPGLIAGYQASVAATHRFNDRTTVGGGARITYVPFRLTGVFSGGSAVDDDGEVVPDLDLAAVRQAYWGRAASMSFSHTLSPRASLTGGLTHRSSELAQSTQGLAHERADMSYRYSVSKGLAVRAGYGYGYWHDSGQYRSNNHLLDAGLDFDRALSFSRRTTLSFSTGTTAIRRYGSHLYRATGSARLRHEMGRSWAATASYFRGLRYYESLSEPVFTNSISAALSGLITRRMQVSTTAWASIGDVGFSPHDKRFDTYAGLASVSYALFRHLSVSAHYARFHYRFDPAVPLPPGTPREIDRNSVRVLVNLWAPILQRARRPDAAR